MRASARYRAALRMLRYTQPRINRQLCALLLALALVSIPLSGIAAPRASSLVPLRTTFVPFDASIQSPNPTPAQFSIAAPSVKRIAIASNANAFPIPPNRDSQSYLTSDSHGHSGAVVLASGRSPPPA